MAFSFCDLLPSIGHRAAPGTEGDRGVRGNSFDARDRNRNRETGIHGALAGAIVLPVCGRHRQIDRSSASAGMEEGCSWFNTLATVR